MHNVGLRYWGLATALGGALWANHKTNCNVCNKPPKLSFISSETLSTLGILTYAALLGSTPYELQWTNTVIKGVAALHLLLVIHMFRAKHFCPACVLTATGALIAASSTAKT